MARYTCKSKNAFQKLPESTGLNTSSETRNEDLIALSNMDSLGCDKHTFVSSKTEAMSVVCAASHKTQEGTNTRTLTNSTSMYTLQHNRWKLEQARKARAKLSKIGVMTLKAENNTAE